MKYCTTIGYSNKMSDNDKSEKYRMSDLNRFLSDNDNWFRSTRS